MWAEEKEVGDGFSHLGCAVWAEGGVGAFDTVEDEVEGDVGGMELDEEAGLVMGELVYDMEVVV